MIFSFESQRTREEAQVLQSLHISCSELLVGGCAMLYDEVIVEAAAVFSSSHGQKVCELWKKSFHNQSAPFLGLLSPLIFYQKWPSSCVLRVRRRQRRHFQHYFVSTKKSSRIEEHNNNSSKTFAILPVFSSLPPSLLAGFFEVF